MDIRNLKVRSKNSPTPLSLASVTCNLFLIIYEEYITNHCFLSLSLVSNTALILFAYNCLQDKCAQIDLILPLIAVSLLWNGRKYCCWFWLSCQHRALRNPFVNTEKSQWLIYVTKLLVAKRYSISRIKMASSVPYYTSSFPYIGGWTKYPKSRNTKVPKYRRLK